MNLRKQFENELDSIGVKLLFESSDVNYIKWLENKNEALIKQLRIDDGDALNSYAKWKRDVNINTDKYP